MKKKNISNEINKNYVKKINNKNKKTVNVLSKSNLKRKLWFEKAKERLENHKPMICKFIISGGCRNDDCAFSHDITPDQMKRILEPCKYYASNECLKSEFCCFMHGDFPCMFFHDKTDTKKCNRGDNCKYSHLPLTPEMEIALQKYIDKEKLRGQVQPTIPIENEKIQTLKENFGSMLLKTKEVAHESSEHISNESFRMSNNFDRFNKVKSKSSQLVSFQNSIFSGNHCSDDDNEIVIEDVSVEVNSNVKENDNLFFIGNSNQQKFPTYVSMDDQESENEVIYQSNEMIPFVNENKQSTKDYSGTVYHKNLQNTLDQSTYLNNFETESLQDNNYKLISNNDNDSNNSGKNSQLFSFDRSMLFNNYVSVKASNKTDFDNQTVKVIDNVIGKEKYILTSINNSNQLNFPTYIPMDDDDSEDELRIDTNYNCRDIIKRKNDSVSFSDHAKKFKDNDIEKIAMFSNSDNYSEKPKDETLNVTSVKENIIDNINNDKDILSLDINVLSVYLPNVQIDATEDDCTKNDSTSTNEMLITNESSVTDKNSVIKETSVRDEISVTNEKCDVNKRPTTNEISVTKKKCTANKSSVAYESSVINESLILKDCYSGNKTCERKLNERTNKIRIKNNDALRIKEKAVNNRVNVKGIMCMDNDRYLNIMQNIDTTSNKINQNKVVNDRYLRPSMPESNIQPAYDEDIHLFIKRKEEIQILLTSLSVKESTHEKLNNSDKIKFNKDKMKTKRKMKKTEKRKGVGFDPIKVELEDFNAESIFDDNFEDMAPLFNNLSFDIDSNLEVKCRKDIIKDVSDTFDVTLQDDAIQKNSITYSTAHEDAMMYSTSTKPKDIVKSPETKNSVTLSDNIVTCSKVPEDLVISSKVTEDTPLYRLNLLVNEEIKKSYLEDHSILCYNIPHKFDDPRICNHRHALKTDWNKWFWKL